MTSITPSLPTTFTIPPQGPAVDQKSKAELNEEAIKRVSPDFKIVKSLPPSEAYKQGLGFLRCLGHENLEKNIRKFISAGDPSDYVIALIGYSQDGTSRSAPEAGEITIYFKRK